MNQLTVYFQQIVEIIFERFLEYIQVMAPCVERDDVIKRNMTFLLVQTNNQANEIRDLSRAYTHKLLFTFNHLFSDVIVIKNVFDIYDQLTLIKEYMYKSYMNDNMVMDYTLAEINSVFGNDKNVSSNNNTQSNSNLGHSPFPFSLANHELHINFKDC
ncbi:unnamed protein product, partial [marine sediment metagenome]